MGDKKIQIIYCADDANIRAENEDLTIRQTTMAAATGNNGNIGIHRQLNRTQGFQQKKRKQYQRNQ